MKEKTKLERADRVLSGFEKWKNLARVQKAIAIEAVLVTVAAAIVVLQYGMDTYLSELGTVNSVTLSVEEGFIKWVDFNVSYEALCEAYYWDVETHDTAHPVHFAELLAYTAARTGGEFGSDALKTLKKAANQLAEGETTIEELTDDLKYYSYYREAYGAVLDGMVGEFEEEYEDENGNRSFRKTYGLKAFFPLAKGFEYTHYDDFGVSRSYGYQRRHLGHDMMGQTGTPIICIESGYVEALGWNQYGGWRIGIRSLDGKRYYYYAHLRQNYPYAEGLEEGDLVTAGDVIGYMGHTGYSTTENVNNIEVTHLHWGLQLIFDESQNEGNGEIWVDVYPLTRFLAKHCQQAQKVGDTREWVRTLGILDPEVEKLNTIINLFTDMPYRYATV